MSDSSSDEDDDMSDSMSDISSDSDSDAEFDDGFQQAIIDIGWLAGNGQGNYDSDASDAPYDPNG